MSISSGMPRVNITEISQDQRIPSFPGVYCYLQIPNAPIGPLKETLISSEAQLLKLYTTNGKIGVDYDEAYWDAEAVLTQTTTLWVKRIVDLDPSHGVKYGGVAIKERTASGANYPFPTGQSDPTAFSFEDQDSFILYQANPGTWANFPGGAFPLAVRLYAYDTDPSKVKLPGAFMVEVYNANNLNVPIEPAWLCSKVQGTKDGFGNNIYVDTVLLKSQYIRSFDNVSTEDSVYPLTDSGSLWSSSIGIAGTGYSIGDILTLTVPIGATAPMLQVTQVGPGGSVTAVSVITRGSGLVTGTSYPTTASPSSGRTGCQIDVTAIGLFFASGANGQTVVDSDMISGLTNIQNPDTMLATILMDGGWTGQPYASALWGIAEVRKDSVAVLSVDPDVEQEADYLAAIKAYRDTTLAANTSYAALYTPHLLIFDKFNNVDRFVPPDGYAAMALSANASNSEFWVPAAGDINGVLSVLGPQITFTEGDMTELYNDEINPIRYTPTRGTRIWGNKTLLQIPEDLQYLNVRCLMIVIEPAIKSFLQGFLFGLNTPALQSKVEATINSYMGNIKSRTGVTDFFAVSNSSNNSATDIQNHVLNVDLYVQPTLDVEYINFQVIITEAGITLQTAK